MSLLLLPVGTIPVGMQVSITSGNQFDGTQSAGTTTLAAGMTKFAPAAAGGLFNFEQSEPIVVHHILADFGVNVTWTLNVVDLDDSGAIIAGETLTYADGTGVAHLSFVTAIVLGPKQAVQLITSGGAAHAKIARAWATTFRGYQG